MDGTVSMSDIRLKFRTPLRILFPKVLKSRDGWKAKSDHRKAQLSSAKVKIRDLTESRGMWRQRAEREAEDKRQLREQLEQSERECAAARAELSQFKDAQKK